MFYWTAFTHFSISFSHFDGVPSQKGCKFCFSYLPSVGESSFKSSRQGFTFKSFLYRAKGKWRSTTVKLYIARPHMMPIKWNQLCSTKHCKTHRKILMRHRHQCSAQCPFTHALSSQPLGVWGEGKWNQRGSIRSQFGCEFLAEVQHRSEDSETKHYYFYKPWVAVETATAAFHLVHLLLLYYVSLHLNINKASMFAVCFLQDNMSTILSLPPILFSVKSLCITTVTPGQIHQYRC